MARDGFFFNVIFSSEPMWRRGFDNNSYEEVRDLTLAYAPYFYENYNRTELLSVSRRAVEEASAAVRREQKENYYSNTSFVEVRNFRHTHVEHRPGTFSSEVRVYNVPQTVRVAVVNDSAGSLVFTHTTDAKIPYRPTDHGYELEQYLIGHYTVVYADGIKTEIPICFGKEIGNRDASWGRTRESATLFAADIYLQQAAHYARPCLLPESTDGFVTMYRYEWPNPRPGAEIREIIFTANSLETPFSVFIADICCLRRREGARA